MAEPRKVAPKIAAKERGPGPGRYLLPSLIGTDNVDQRVQIKPCYTFGTHVRLKPTDGKLGPSLGCGRIWTGPWGAEWRGRSSLCKKMDMHGRICGRPALI